jgi:hypothetical protein
MKQLIEIIKELDLFKKNKKIQSLDIAIIDNHYYASGYSCGAKVLEIKGDFDE